MIKELIYQYFENERLNKEKREIDKTKEFNIAPSYLSDCIRKIYYKKTNTPASNPTSLHSYIKFALGDAVHKKLQDILSRITYFKKCEIFKDKIMDNFKWVYRLDGSVLILTDECIIEIKSIYGNNNYNELPKKDNIMQLFACMKLEEKKHGILLYICRDTGFIEEFNYTIDKLEKEYGELYKKRLEKLLSLKNCIENKTEPEREFQLYLKNKNGVITESFQKDNVKYYGGWQCSKKDGNTYCPYRDLCWQKELEEIKNYSFYINGEFIK